MSEAEVNLMPADPSLAREALGLSLKLGITVYDAAYIALARALSAPLYTGDEKLLANSKIQALGFVRHVRDYTTPRDPPTPDQASGAHREP